MNRFLLITVCIFMSGSAHAQSAQYKGYEAIGKELTTRLLPTGNSLTMASYLPEPGLLKLLGGWQPAGSEHAFRNGLPNSVSMLVWYMGLSGLADAVAGSCETPGSFKTNDSFAPILARLCRWPAADAQSEDSMMDFWIAMMGYQAPEEEYTAWRDFFRTSSYRTMPPTDAVRAMALGIFMNPFFLLAN